MTSAQRPGQACFVIHGHFYQPPREEPWLEEILAQPSASPYHDWNERIDDQCYAPNGYSRVLDDQGRILDLVNNYSYLSFDFGPTLLSWLQKKALSSYEQIIRADYESQQRFSRGSALACAYNHMILPLANKRDRETQVIWGIKDFIYHFGREPEGMWLPEAAVNYPTLEVLAENQIKFVILSPYQARAVRPLGSRKWREVRDGQMDITQPYRCCLPGGKHIGIFFYDGPISSDMSFTNLMTSAGNLADRFKHSFPPLRGKSRIAAAATDGETFGHHRPFADMCLSYLFTREGPKKGLRFNNFAAYLVKHPTTWEVQLKNARESEGTSWSCAHGIERWRGDCGCTTNSQPGWNQKWRAPLRAALDWLRDELVQVFSLEAVRYLNNPWAARNDYIEVINQRKPLVQERFLRRHGRHLLTEAEEVKCWKLLEMQRSAQLMYTSCGWFFSELSGIETVQNLKYAARALELAEEFTRRDLKKSFLAKLAQAKSNHKEYADGRGVWEKLVEPARTSWDKVACHGAILSQLENFGRWQLYQFAITKKKELRVKRGANILLAGILELACQVTREKAERTFLLFIPPGGAVRCYLRASRDERFFNRVANFLRDLTDSSDKALTARIEELMGARYLTLADTFFDQYENVVRQILKEKMGQLRQKIEHLYQFDREMLEYFGQIGWPLPEELKAITQYVLNWRLNELLEKLGQSFEIENYNEVRGIIETARRLGVVLSLKRLARDLTRLILDKMEYFRKNPQYKEGIRLKLFIELARQLKLEIDLTKIQNAFWRVIRENYPAHLELWLREKKAPDRRRLLEVILELAKSLNFSTAKERAVLGRDSVDQRQR